MTHTAEISRSLREIKREVKQFENESNGDRWKANRPTGPAPPCLRIWSLVILAALFVLASLAVGASVALGQESDDRPVLYVFSSPGCAPCTILKREFANDAGSLKKFDRTYRVEVIDLGERSERTSAAVAAFVSAVPAKQKLIDLDGAGKRDTRPPGRGIHSVPIVWIDGRSDYWQGYNRRTLNDLAYYLEFNQPISPVSTDQPEPTPVAAPKTYERSEPPTLEPAGRLEPIADPMFAAPATPKALPIIGRGLSEAAEPAVAAPVAPDPDFSGVTVVVLVASLADGAESLRSEVARRANVTLQHLAAKHIGERVQAYLITEVGDPELYERMVEIVGVRPGIGTQRRAAALVLIPERLDGFVGMITGKAEQALANRFLPGLKDVGLMPVVERIHGGTFDAVLAALTDRGGGETPTNQPFVYLVATYLSERSKFGEWLARRFGWVA